MGAVQKCKGDSATLFTTWAKEEFDAVAGKYRDQINLVNVDD